LLLSTSALGVFLRVKLHGGRKYQVGQEEGKGQAQESKPHLKGKNTNV